MAICGEHGGLALQRGPDGEVVRGPDGKVQRRPCEAYALVGSNPPRCMAHLSGGSIENRRLRLEREAVFVRKHWGEIAALLSGTDFPELNPMDALLEVVRRTGAMMRMLELLVGELPVDPDVITTLNPDGELENMVKPGLWGFNRFGEQAPHIFVQLLGVWTDRHMRASKMALDAGIDERLVRNAEATQVTLLAAFQAAMRTVQLPDDVRSALNRAFARELRSAIDPASSRHVLDVDSIPQAPGLSA